MPWLFWCCCCVVVCVMCVHVWCVLSAGYCEMLYEMMFCVLLCLCACLCLAVRFVRDALCDAVWLVCVALFCVCVCALW